MAAIVAVAAAAVAVGAEAETSLTERPMWMREMTAVQFARTGEPHPHRTVACMLGSIVACSVWRGARSI